MARLTRAERRRFLDYPVLLGLGAAALASCFGQEAQPPPAPLVLHRMSPPPEMTARSPVVPRPSRKPPPPLAGTGSASSGPDVAMTEPKPTTAAPAPGAETSPAPTAPHASDLIGLDESAATRLFGHAAEQSEEAPATIWRYKNAGCELDLFFYLDLRSGRMRTLHYALKSDGADAARGQDCLRSLVASRGS